MKNDPPPEDLIKQIEAVLARMEATADFAEDEVRELRLVLRAVGSNPIHHALLAQITEAIRQARPGVIARIVDAHPGAALDEATADRCGPDQLMSKHLDPTEIESINSTLHQRHQSTQQRVYREMHVASTQGREGFIHARNAVVAAFKLHLVEALAEYSCCVALLRETWSTLPKEVHLTARIVSGRAVFGLVTAKLLPGIRAIAMAVRAGDTDTDQADSKPE